MTGELPRTNPPTSTFSRTVNPLKSRIAWNVRAMPRRASRCGGSRVMSSPANRMVPSSARKCPEMRLMSVVLPAPFGPMSPNTCLSGIARSIVFTATTPPNRLVSERVSSNIFGPHAAKPHRSPEIEERREAAG